ncbi:hypothetical protein EGW08_011720, partial [Elysia chlorotica]
MCDPDMVLSVKKGKMCVAYGCSNQDADPALRGKFSFHQFPFRWGDQYVKEWTLKIKRENFSASKYMVVCSEHFENSCFEYQNFTGRRQLKRGSIPTIFKH